MVKLWALRVSKGLSTIEEVPERYLAQIKLELGITQ